MPHSKKHAKRLLSELHLPDGAEEALRHPSYWDPVFVRLYLDRCDEVIFHDPHVGLKLALVAPDLAFLVPEGRRPEDRLAHREQLVRAYAVLGGAYRATSRLSQADEPYRMAVRLSEAISPAARADLYQRLAALRAWQKRFDEAIRLAGEAAVVFRSLKQFDQLASALAAQAFAWVEARRFSEALTAASEALCYSDPKVNPRVHYSATHNLAYAAVHSTDLGTIGLARAKIREARRLITHHRRSVPKLKLYWVEGILMKKLFARGRAEKLFEKARKGFLALDAVYESALATLDLSGLLYVQGRWQELEIYAREAFERFREVAADEEAIAALKLWLEAIEQKTLGNQLLTDVRETVIACMVRHRGAP